MTPKVNVGGSSKNQPKLRIYIAAVLLTVEAHEARHKLSSSGIPRTTDRKCIKENRGLKYDRTMVNGMLQRSVGGAKRRFQHIGKLERMN